MCMQEVNWNEWKKLVLFNMFPTLVQLNQGRLHL